VVLTCLPHVPLCPTWAWVEWAEEFHGKVDSVGNSLRGSFDLDAQILGTLLTACAWPITVYVAFIWLFVSWITAMYLSYAWFLKQAVDLVAWEVFNWPLRWLYHNMAIVIYTFLWACRLAYRASKMGLQESTRRRYYWVFYLLLLAFPTYWIELLHFLFAETFDYESILDEEFLEDMDDWDRSDKKWYYEYFRDYDKYYEPTFTRAERLDEAAEDDGWGGRYWW
jgi:hypothetical protein